MNFLIAFLALASAGVFAAHAIDALRAHDTISKGAMGLVRINRVRRTSLRAKPVGSKG